MQIKTLLFVGRVSLIYYGKIPKGQRTMQRLDWYLCRAYRIGRFVLAIEYPVSKWKPKDELSDLSTDPTSGVPPDAPEDRP